MWRRRAAALIPSATRILDLACGTGDFCLVLQKHFSNAEVSGIDISAGMLDVARLKCPQMTFMQSDVLDANWGAPDAITCAFGFRNFADKDAVLAKAASTLPIGRHLLVLELWRPTNRFLGFCVSAWLRIFAALFARGSIAEYSYLRHSIEATLSADEFIAHAESIGLSLVRRIDFFPAATATLFRRYPHSASQQSNTDASKV